MASLNFTPLLSIIFSLMLIFRCTMASPPPVKGAYWPSWVENFPPSAIDTTLFTHVYYAFVVPSNITFKLEIPNSDVPLLRNFSPTLHHKHPPVKTILSIGGGGVGPEPFSKMASQPESRKIFIDSTIEVARKFGFDGLDLDWESPQNQKEMQDMGELLKEWRNAIQKEAKFTNRPPLLLTAAVYFAVEFLWQNNYRRFPAASIAQNLDWIGVMCYDYRGSWDTSATGAQALLYDSKSNISTSYGLNSWIRAGVPRNKIVMGLPLYGRTWTLKDPNLNGIGAPAVGVGPGNDGVLLFSEIERFNKDNGATVVYDVPTVSTYSHSGSAWVGYDDTRSTTTKIEFAQALKLRGYFFWALSYDSNWKISRQASRAWVKKNLRNI